MKITAALETWLSLQWQIAGSTALICIALVLSCAGIAAEMARQQAVRPPYPIHYSATFEKLVGFWRIGQR